MSRGFYTLTSGMISQNRNLNVISNNLTNVMTPGFKKNTFLSGAFQEQLLSRTGNINKANSTPLNDVSMMRAPIETTTNYNQGALEETGITLDFALTKKGFFQVQKENGEIVYTRDGSFNIDEEGYLALPHVGRVLGTNGTIYLNTDDVTSDKTGTIYIKGETAVDSLAIVDFNDYTQLTKVGEGLFQGPGQTTNVQNAILWKTVERSNVNPTEEMTAMMSSQRAIQSSAQMLKIYDQLMGKDATELGRV